VYEQKNALEAESRCGYKDMVLTRIGQSCPSQAAEPSEHYDDNDVYF